MPEQSRRGADVAALQRLARGGRGHRVERALLVGHDLFDNFDLDGQFRPGLPQEGGRARAPRAEMEIIAHDHGAAAKPPRQHVAQEALGVELRQGRVKSEDEHAVQAKLRHAMRLGVAAGQAEDRAGPAEIIRRMRLEGQDGARLAETPGQ